MGFFDGFLTELAGDVIGGVAEDFSFGGFVGDALSSFAPQPVARPISSMGGYPQPVMASVPMAARAVAAGLPAWSARFPALWQAIQKLRAQGTKATVEQLYGLLRKWGPASLSTVIGAAAVSDLVSYRMRHKPRRMNPANTKALRRSLRRLKSFDKLAGRVKTQLSGSCSKRRSYKKCA